MKFRPALAFTLFCDEVQMLHHQQSYKSLNYWLFPLYNTSVYIIVYQMWCCHCVFSAQHIAEV